MGTVCTLFEPAFDWRALLIGACAVMPLSFWLGMRVAGHDDFPEPMQMNGDKL